ncbi:hypothetical protein RM780_09805 [Streptomyces sp. DSM 44917]|uniref:Uncharacterized protein n=1 Tax=Streptomyces boetiae TaxID=3075541 RepID=A0ABU2L727_9ACTN|nr:hypothetical protein [Streptomyces sp. DSM 44917]MDT0307256.1 hypothetical protein [Streptomyces sp. DSM 44917]
MEDIAQDAGLSVADRARRVAPLWTAYRSRYPDSLIRDMVADLMHLITAEGGDPDREIDAAIQTHDAERDT